MLKPGDEFAGYRVRGILGMGGMGAVFRAAQANLERDVALKVMQDLDPDDRQTARRFVRETRIHIALHHPNLVKVLDAGVHEGRRYLVMELVEGPSLDAFLAGFRDDRVEFGLRTSHALTLAVEYLHRMGIVHRDLKPQNILLDIDRVPKITDFGIARRVDATLVTMDRGIIGTLPYMAPEVIAEEAIESPADVYALGLVMYEIFTGKVAQDADTVEEIVRLIRSGRPRPPSSFSPRIPRGLDALIETCLEKDPAARPSATQVKERLTAILEKRELSSPELGAREEPTAAHRRAKLVLPREKASTRAQGGVRGGAGSSEGSDTPGESREGVGATWAGAAASRVARNRDAAAGGAGAEVASAPEPAVPSRARRGLTLVGLVSLALAGGLAAILLREGDGGGSGGVLAPSPSSDGAFASTAASSTPSRTTRSRRHGLLDRLAVKHAGRLHVRARTVEAVKLTLSLPGGGSTRRVLEEESPRRWHAFDVEGVGPDVTEVTYGLAGAEGRVIPARDRLREHTETCAGGLDLVLPRAAMPATPADAIRVGCLFGDDARRALLAALGRRGAPLDPEIIVWAGMIGDEPLADALSPWLTVPEGWTDPEAIRLQYARTPLVVEALCRSRSPRALPAIRDYLLGSYRDWMLRYPEHLEVFGVRLYMQQAFRLAALHRPDELEPILKSLDTKDAYTTAHVRAYLSATPPATIREWLLTTDPLMRLGIVRGLRESRLTEAHLPMIQEYILRTDRAWEERLRTAMLAAAHPSAQAGKILDYVVQMASGVEKDTHRILSLCVRLAGLNGGEIPLGIATKQLTSRAWETRRGALRSLILALFHARYAGDAVTRVDRAALAALASGFDRSPPADDVHTDKVLFLALRGAPQARAKAEALHESDSEYRKWMAATALLIAGEDAGATSPVARKGLDAIWRTWSDLLREPPRPGHHLFLVDPTLPFLPTGLALSAGDHVRLRTVGIAAPRDPVEGHGDHDWSIEDAETTGALMVAPEDIWLEAHVAEEPILRLDEDVMSVTPSSGFHERLVPVDGELVLSAGPRADWFPAEDWIFRFRPVMRHTGWMLVKVEVVRDAGD